MSMSLLKALLIGLNLISRSIQQTIDTPLYVDADLDSVVDIPPLWVKVLSCTEGTGLVDTDAENRFTFNYDESTMRQLASTANTLKIEPPNGELNPEHNNFAVRARPDSDAVHQLNQFSEVTSTMDTNWVGTDSA
eukprot:55360_1